MSTAPIVLDQIDDRTLELLEWRRRSSVIRPRGWLMRRMLLVSDVIGLSVAFTVAEILYAQRTRAGAVDVPAETLLFALSLPLWVVVAKLYGLYARDEERVDHSTADDVLGVFHLATVGTWLLFIAARVTRIADPELPKLIVFWLGVVVLVPTLRSIARAFCRRSVYYLQNTLIVGAGTVGQEVARKILRHPEYGFNVVGFVDSMPRERAEDLEHLTVLGDCADVPQLVRLLDVDRVIIAFSNDPHIEMLDLLRELSGSDIQIDIVPRLYEVLGSGVDVHSVEGVPLIGVRPAKLASSSALLKRAFDLVVGSSVLILLTPLLLAVAIAIKLDSPGPIFFRQVRMGSGGRTFRIFKFRTMTADAEARKEEFAHLNKHAHSGGDPRMFKIEHDPRTTRVGSVIRRGSLDELPQLLNVVRGEMSLVGPRPLILDEHQYVEAWARRRLELKPGITGLWQVLGRSDIPFQEMVRLDYLYVTGWSIFNDMKLIARTLPALFRGNGAL